MDTNTITEKINQIEEMANECQDTIDALQHILIQARKSVCSLRSACEHVEEVAELRAIAARDGGFICGDAVSFELDSGAE